MYLSVILTTYNQPEWLEKVIWGYSAQTHRDFELIIADDGSGDETRHRLDRLRDETGLTIRYVWHEDHGFRKCTILNRAIVAAQHDYLIFSDGDCIPRHDFLAVHARHATPGRFLSGGYVKLPMVTSQAITRDDILSGRATSARWLCSNGLRWTPRLLKLSAGPRLAAMLDALTTTKATWNGHNASGWKTDIMCVNGYDERMEWGGLDRELGERLMNAGIRGKCIRYRAVCVHLDHGHGYVRAECVARNRSIRREVARTAASWTPFGILKQPRPAIRAA